MVEEPPVHLIVAHESLQQRCGQCCHHQVGLLSGEDLSTTVPAVGGRAAYQQGIGNLCVHKRLAGTLVMTTLSCDGALSCGGEHIGG